MAVNMEYWICPCCGNGFRGLPAGSSLCPDCEDFMPVADTSGDSPSCPGCGSGSITRSDFGTAGIACMCTGCGVVWREVTSHAS